MEKSEAVNEAPETMTKVKKQGNKNTRRWAVPRTGFPQGETSVDT